MVTSTGSGLSVPDWPLSYGSLFPPMIGGVFYEHGHRIAAALVGLLILILSISLHILEKRKWVKILGFIALGIVIAQGILGGLTVLLFLPTAISLSHAVLAQTFFLLTITIAYSLSLERGEREEGRVTPLAISPLSLKSLFFFLILIYIQLILGALMRHTHSGLAIPDFPTMGGYWLPPSTEALLKNINSWRFEHNLESVTIQQVAFHFIHRLMAFTILLWLGVVNCKLWGELKLLKIKSSLFLVNTLVALQIFLGIVAVLSQKSPALTSLHVVTGAAALGYSYLLFLRLAPLSWRETKKNLFH